MLSLRVMSVNVRQPDEDDGVNNWNLRKQLLLETIAEGAPDVIGTQELFVEQAQYLEAGLGGFHWFGAGRFGDARDKHVGIFYRAAALRLVDSGTFWISGTPKVPGSSAWGIIRPRQVTWGQFEQPTGVVFHLFNTHFPYRQEEAEARRQTVRLLLQYAEGLSPVILTGDFNAPAGGEIHDLLLAAGFRDAWLDAETRVGPEGTLNGFGRVTEPRRIDWILYRAPWRTRLAATLARQQGGVYPSDHYPVLAEFGNTAGA